MRLEDELKKSRRITNFGEMIYEKTAKHVIGERTTFGKLNTHRKDCRRHPARRER
jgi:hypothetical protein